MYMPYNVVTTLSLVLPYSWELALFRLWKDKNLLTLQSLSGMKQLRYGAAAGSMLVEVCLLYKQRYIPRATPSPIPVSELSFYEQHGSKLSLGMMYMSLSEWIPVFQVLTISMYKEVQIQHSKHYVSDRWYLFENFKITKDWLFLIFS